MSPHSLRVGDLIRGTYPTHPHEKKSTWLGIITDRDGDWLEITWEDGDIDQYDLHEHGSGTEEMTDHWEVVSESG